MGDELRGAAVECLRNSGVIVHATETVYGLAAAWDDRKAVERISRLKQRPAAQPYSLMVAAIADVFTLIGGRTPELNRLLEALFPAPLTLLLPRLGDGPLPEWNAFPLIGIRIPAHELSRFLVSECGRPLITTSANVSGEPPPVTAGDVGKSIRSGVDMVLDSGPCEYRVPSTIAEISFRPLRYRLIRQGAYPEERISAGLRKAAGHQSR